MCAEIHPKKPYKKAEILHIWKIQVYIPPIGSIYHSYTATYSPCLLGGYMLPTTFYGAQKQPLVVSNSVYFTPT